MLSPRCYANVARIGALLLGAGSISWSMSDPERLRAQLGECSITYHATPPTACSGPRQGWRWSSCDALARELAMSGALLLLAVLPVKRSDPL
jgi:hypothetical protein